MDIAAYRKSKGLSQADLAAKLDVNQATVSRLENGVAPSRPLAIHIFRKTGWKHDAITDLTDEQIAVLETVEPWKPLADRAA